MWTLAIFLPLALGGNVLSSNSSSMMKYFRGKLYINPFPGSSYEYPDYNGEEYEYNDYKDYQEGDTAQIPVNLFSKKSKHYNKMVKFKHILTSN